MTAFVVVFLFAWIHNDITWKEAAGMYEYKRVFLAVDDKSEAETSNFKDQIGLLELEGWQFVTKAFRPNTGGQVILTFKREVDEE